MLGHRFTSGGKARQKDKEKIKQVRIHLDTFVAFSLVVDLDAA